MRSLTLTALAAAAIATAASADPYNDTYPMMSSEEAATTTFNLRPQVGITDWTWQGTTLIESWLVYGAYDNEPATPPNNGIRNFYTWPGAEPYRSASSSNGRHFADSSPSNIYFEHTHAIWADIYNSESHDWDSSVRIGHDTSWYFDTDDPEHPEPTLEEHTHQAFQVITPTTASQWTLIDDLSFALNNESGQIMFEIRLSDHYHASVFGFNQTGSPNDSQHATPNPGDSLIMTWDTEYTGVSNEYQAAFVQAYYSVPEPSAIMLCLALSGILARQ
ncbi:hypothetical protein [Mucisphaera calidilacus]|uniref:Uncharacterized protein n=1 Tax=Mucisphaera calidilacus TaxID=2527982 RepID=A0A518C037_9BACT|nr:hypothetical protein [Mucisphaera calidilacus]QDU72582.1 hypothetical protein Pan265_24520 [Mucisphaera calidilacus]